MVLSQEVMEAPAGLATQLVLVPTRPHAQALPLVRQAEGREMEAVAVVAEVLARLQGVLAVLVI